MVDVKVSEIVAPIHWILEEYDKQKDQRRIEIPKWMILSLKKGYEEMIGSDKNFQSFFRSIHTEDEIKKLEDSGFLKK